MHDVGPRLSDRLNKWPVSRTSRRLEGDRALREFASQYPKTPMDFGGNAHVQPGEAHGSAILAPATGFR
jgi:hypothetical protein